MSFGTATLGAVAGLAGSLSMHVSRLAWEAGTKNQPEHGIYGFDREADVSGARLFCSVFSDETIREEDAAAIGLALHYGYGAAIGTLYAALSSRTSRIRLGFGTVFGSLLWLLADEIPVSMSGVSRPLERSTASHAGALAVHLLFGVTVEAVTRAAANR